MSAIHLVTNRARVARFIAVGCVAAAVHWAVVVGLVDHWRWWPLLANVVGWFIAFSVSFTGHYQLTFSDSSVPMRSSISRFFVVSALGFAINEMSYACLLYWGGIRYDLVLGLILVIVAMMTFLLSRYWAFLRSEVT